MPSPREITIVRHAQSAGNLAAEKAHAAGAQLIDIAPRDADVPLSDLGRRQAQALGEWLTDQQACDVAYVSPYRRARETLEIGLRAAQWSPPVFHDERIREKELGILDRLTRLGVQARFPDQYELRVRVGKFYYRPPGGESWADVVLRQRSFFESLMHAHDEARVLIVTHQVVVLGFRYIIESLTEEQLLTIDAQADVANCSVTRYSRRNDGKYKLETYNETAPLEEAGEHITSAPDSPVGPR